MAQKTERRQKSPYIVHIVSTIEARIRGGVYPGGRWLPTERELCAEFDVSRATLRQALVELENTSLVIRSAGCRPFVKFDGAHSSDNLSSLKTVSSRMTVGLCVKQDYKYSGTYLITQGVREAANTDSIRLLIAGSSAQTLEQVAQEEAQSLMRMVRDKDIRGIVIWYSGGESNIPILHEVQAANIPMVFVDRAPPAGIEADFVSIDNRRAAFNAVQYLIHKGHRRIAHVSNPEPVTTVYDRSGGYRDALKANAIAIDTKLEMTGRLETMAEEGFTAHEIIDSFFNLEEPPTAIFAVTDFIAQALVRALEDRGKRVPADMAIIGFDDLEQWFPQKAFLTTVRQPFDRIGFEAANLLFKRLQGISDTYHTHLMLDASLIVRESA